MIYHRVRQDTREGLAGVRLLLVEDNRINQQVVSGILARLGIGNVDIAENGAEALEALRITEKRYDLILMDIRMPVMDGLEATKRIRRKTTQDNSFEVPIIALTAHTLKSDLQRCIEAGMNDFITKPVLPEMLEGILLKWLHPYSRKADKTTIAPLQQCKGHQVEGQTGEQALPAALVDSRHSEDGWEHSPVFDYHGLKERLMGNDRMVKEIIDVYCSRLPGQLEKLKELIEAGSQGEVLKLVHDLKGSSGSVGAMQLFWLFKSLEHAAGRDESLQKLLVVIDNHVQTLSTVLHRYI